MNLRFLHPLFSDLGDGGSAIAQVGEGWATASLVASLRRIVFSAAVGWQLVMIFAVFASLGIAGWPLALAQGGLGGLALAMRRRASPSYLVPGLMSLLALCGYLASGDIDSTLSFASCWQLNFASCFAAMLVFRAYLLPVVACQAILTSAALLLRLPDWGTQLPISIVVTQVSIVVALRLGLPALLRVSSAADAEAAEAERGERAARLTRGLSERVAEEARVLHDTAINTLGAIANGSVGAVRGDRVREQCARDVTQLHGLRSRRADRDEATLRDVFDLPGLPIIRTGLDDGGIARISAALPDRVVSGIVGCVREALTNTAKHSGADHAEIGLTVVGDRLRIVLSDRGVGFEGAAPSGRGIERSILERAADHGFSARVMSSPGEGTDVVLEIPLDSRAEDLAEAESPHDVDALVARLYRRAGTLWGAGVTAVSVVLTLGGGTNRFFALYPMIGIMILAWGLARLPAERLGKSGRPMLAVLLVVCTDLVFFLSAAATGFGTQGTAHWQALAATGPFALLLAARPSRRAIALGASSWAVLVVLIAMSVLPTSVAAAQTVVVAGCVGLGFSAVWAVFQASVASRSVAAAQARRRAFAARLDLELTEAAQSSYRRWLDAGLDSAIGILHSIADGERSPDSPQTRAACGDEEQYLRQLVQISPELVHLGRELIASLRYARARDVRFVLRVGGADAPDEAVARRIASALHRGVREALPGEALNATLFPVSGGLQLTLTGSSLPALDSETGIVRREQFGAMQLLEVTYPDGSGHTEEHYGAGSGSPLARLPRRDRRGSRAATRAHRGAARA